MLEASPCIEEVAAVPYKPKTPCRYPGCPKLSAERFCPQHTQVEDQRYRRYQRDPEINLRYGTVWRKIRTRYLDAHTLCEDCLKAGHTTPAVEVHHVVPLSHGGSHDVSTCGPCANPATHASPLVMVTGGETHLRCLPITRTCIPRLDPKAYWRNILDLDFQMLAPFLMWSPLGKTIASAGKTCVR